MAREFATIEQAVEDLKAGKLILCVDDPDRENEGDLICAAEFATTENINFMAVHAKGLICMPMSGKRCDDLGLTQMVTANTDNHETAFTVSIDHMSTTTGISAVERSITALKTVEEGVQPHEFRRPGHMFPLRAKDGGVLVRSGHTEATVDLMRIAGLKDASPSRTSSSTGSTTRASSSGKRTRIFRRPTATSRSSVTATPSTENSTWLWSWAMWRTVNRSCAGSIPSASPETSSAPNAVTAETSSIRR